VFPGKLGSLTHYLSVVDMLWCAVALLVFVQEVLTKI